MAKNKRRGRPIGFKLSESSKRAISESKKGQKHKKETKDKISKSLIIYFRNKHPLSEELTNMYCYEGENCEEVMEWVEENGERIDSITDVMTLKSLRNANRIELTAGDHIEFFSHEMTPELIVLFLETCRLEGKDPEDYFDELGY